MSNAPINWRDYALNWLDAYACGQDLRAVARATVQAIRVDLGEGGKLPDFLTFRKVAVSSLLGALPPRPQDSAMRPGLPVSLPAYPELADLYAPTDEPAGPPAELLSTRCPLCGAEDLGECDCDPEAVNAALRERRAAQKEAVHA